MLPRVPAHATMLCNPNSAKYGQCKYLATDNAAITVEMYFGCTVKEALAVLILLLLDSKVVKLAGVPCYLSSAPVRPHVGSLLLLLLSSPPPPPPTPTTATTTASLPSRPPSNDPFELARPTVG